MQIDFFGANVIRIKTKQVSIVFDDNLKALGAKSITSEDDVAVSTNEKIVGLPDKYSLDFTLPGEYEVGDIMLTGVAAQAHIDEKGTHNATIFRGIVGGEIRFVVLGHVAGELTDEQLEAIGMVDILFIPVGGNGYTLDAVAAAKLAKQLEAKMIIPTHFEQKGIKYEVPQTNYEEFVKIMNIQPRKESNPLKIKKSDLQENPELVILG